MKSKEKKSDMQVMLFDLIQKSLPHNIALVDEVSELLNVGTDATYRRIRGEKPISLEEAMKLCRHYQISIDSLADIVPDNDHIRCRYTPLNLENLESYLTFIKSIANNIENTKYFPESEIILSAVDVPLLNILSYSELIFLKLFSWSKTVYAYSSPYEEFVNQFNNSEIKKYHDKIVQNYLLIPSSEIWTTHTVDPILKLIDYHSELGHFSDGKLPLLFCEQLLDLLNKVQTWAENGKKGAKNIRFSFYVSETDIGSTFILLKNAERSNCLIRLYTINGLNISDERFCMETESWLRNSAKRSTLLSEASEKDRFKFFEAQRQKIRFLIEKIQKSF